MHKITKGIKKKIKSKKGNKGDDLFDPAELEKYRKEKEQREAAAAAAASEEGAEGGEGGGRAEAGEEPREGAEAEGAKEEDEEWQRFKALTAGVDSVLKKTQGDLDRIKSTSYFQRKKPGGGDRKITGPGGAAAEPKESASKGPAAGVKPKRWVGFEEGSAVDEEAPEEEVKGAKEAEAAKAEEEEKPQEAEEKAPEEEEEEEELAEEEDIFDTSYVDVVASGELKLAYIPESPTTEGPGEGGFDPFDTSIAEKVIGPEPESQKGKKPRQLVSLGCAVDVLTGRLDKAQVVPNPTQASKKRRVTSRRPEDVDLFILDDDAEPQEPKEANPPGSGVPSRRASGATLDPFGALDENGIPDTTPIGEALNTVPPPKDEDKEEAPKEVEELVLKDLVAEFDIIGETEPVPIEAEEELIFTTKQESKATVKVEEEDEFAALAAESAKKKLEPPRDLRFKEEVEEEEEDPFDTSVAAGILGELPTTPQKAPPVRPPRPVSSPDVDVLLGGGKDEDFGWEKFDQDRSGVIAHPPLRPAPLSAGPPPRPSKPPGRPPPITGTAASDEGFVPSLGQPPLTFTETAIEAITRDLDSKLEAVDTDDPFDTSFAEVVAVPGRAELRLIESEILGDVEDDTFDPRAEDNASVRQEVFSSVKIQISLPAGEEGAEQQIGGEAVARGVSNDLFDSTGDPEEEFVSSLQLSHRDLLGGSTTDLSKLGHDPISPDEAIESKEEEIEEYVDPFDTSVVDPKIAPGKAELKIIEKELLGEGEVAAIAEPVGLKRNLSDPDFDPRGEEEAPGLAENHALPEADISRPDLLEAESRVQTEPQAAESILSPSARPDLLSVGEEAEAEFSKPLTPLVEEGERISEAILKTDGVDPFDTTFAENILPGKAELRIIESELFGGPDVTAGTGITRSLSDPDFDPRESSGGEKEDLRQSEAASANRRRFSDVSALSGGIGPRSPRVVHPTTLPLQSIANPAPGPRPTAVKQNQPDLLAVEEEPESACKPLSPARETSEADEGDPFDTSTVSVEVLKPGKAELKILENELIGGSEEDKPAPTYQANITAQVQAFVVTQYQSAQPLVANASEQVSIEVKPPDLLNLPESDQEPAGPKPLTPLIENSDFPEGDDFDPFDTSIAEGIGPGKTELKLLESELIGQ